MRTISHNIYVGQKEAEAKEHLNELADRFSPKVFALQEAQRLDGSIPGYDRFAWDGGHRDNSSNVLLVRRNGVAVHNNDFLRNTGDHWHGPKHGKIHPPRVFPWVTLEDDDGWWNVICVHRTPWGNWQPEHQALVKWAKNKVAPHVMLGDWNARHVKLMPLALRTHSRIATIGIDGAVVSRSIRVLANQKLQSKFGSDAHHPVVTDLERKR